MRVVVDTNVFVSAAIKNSSWPGGVVRWIDRHGGFLKSKFTEAQVIEVLQRPYIQQKLPPFYLDSVRRIFSRAELVDIVERVVACRDPTDDKFLELAVSGMADVIVSGDRDLLVLNPFRGIPIVDPAAFARGVAGS
jgi:putative PIN family toxin of toxin-antitoxin system